MYRRFILFFCALLLFAGAAHAQWNGYRYQTIPLDFPNHPHHSCDVLSIDDRGIIYGVCNDDLDRGNSGFAFSYDGRNFKEIDIHIRVPGVRGEDEDAVLAQPVLRGKRLRVLAGPTDFNNRGHMTGVAIFGDRRLHGFLKTNNGPRVTPLTVPGAILTEATGLNDFDEVVGDYRDEDGVFHGFRYFNGRFFFPLDFPGSPLTGINAINNRGQFVGCSGLCNQGFVFDPRDSKFTPINMPGAVLTSPTGINDLGQILGVYSIHNEPVQGFILDERGFTLLRVPGALVTNPIKMNNAGQIVGGYVIETAPGVFEHRSFLAWR
jgi:hypothetical protein